MKITISDKNNYVLKDKENLIILSKIKNLENRDISKTDKYLVRLIKTQLKKNWRAPLIKELNKIEAKYK